MTQVGSSSRCKGSWNREKWRVQISIVIFWRLEGTGQAGSHTGTPPDGAS